MKSKICLIVIRISKFIFLILPLGVTTSALLFGFLLSIAEDWPFEDCFWLMMGEVTQLDIEMVGKEYEIQKTPGKIAASLCGIWSLGFLAVIIGIAGNLLIYPSIKPSTIKINKHTTMPALSPSSFTELEKVYNQI